MKDQKKLRVGIGFATGRRSFQKVLKAYAYTFKESGLTKDDKYSLNLFVAYDLKYYNTKEKDYINISGDVRELLDDISFIGHATIGREIEHLIDNNIINRNEAVKVFAKRGYAAKRNSLLYMAMKNKIDYLIFLDDDEYPMAVTKTGPTAIWSGQHVLFNHLKYIEDADITHGHHCGYISPIPYIEFNETMKEKDFRMFIEAISNDIISWDKIKKIMAAGGVTYANTSVLSNNKATIVPEINKCKFISGANLCINMTSISKVKPFYNPPGARGEDTFLSTLLGNHNVIKIPTYTFHDGFSTYNHLLDGVLPVKLKYISGDSEQIINRFYRACLGWIRYKPLLTYIIDQDGYNNKIEKMRKNLAVTLPKICTYFDKPDFMDIMEELDHYHKNVEKHYREFMEVQNIWNRICAYIERNE